MPVNSLRKRLGTCFSVLRVLTALHVQEGQLAKEMTTGQQLRLEIEQLNSKVRKFAVRRCTPLPADARNAHQVAGLKNDKQGLQAQIEAMTRKHAPLAISARFSLIVYVAQATSRSARRNSAKQTQHRARRSRARQEPTSVR
jgi:hypothetical protein